jgi:hypothetical protein
MDRPEIQKVGIQFSDEEWAGIRARAGGRVTYAPLREREFRVLLLHPGEKSDPILCQVVRQDLDHIVQDYVALSYTWGDATKTAAIHCLMNDREPAHERHPPRPEDVSLGNLKATANLVAALRHFRHREFNCAIWIDAICIDQENVDERNQQVRVMAEIYIRAQKTAIWLGESSAVSGAGLAFVDKLFHAPRHEGTASLIEELTPERASSRSHWEGIADILHRPWFTRVWVRQELVFSRDPGLVCGEDTLAWEKFDAVIPGLLATQLGFSDGTAPKHGLHHTKLLRLTRAMVRRTGWMESMLEKELLVMLWFCRECGATDPRDKVISVLGLCSPVQHSILPKLDYSLTTERLYLGVALASMVMFRDLNVLSHAGSSVKSNPAHASLPSWVPDWSVPWSVNVIDTPLPDHGYRAAGDTKADPKFDPDRPDRVGLTGRLVDIICEVAEATPSFDHLFTTQRRDLFPSGSSQLRIQEWAMSLESMRLECERSSSAMASTEALWRTLCVNKARSDHHGMMWQGLNVVPYPTQQLTAPADYAQSFRAWCAWYIRPLGDDVKISFTELEDLKEWQTAMISAAHNRRFGITATGYMFLGPRDARPGDVVCVLNGGNVPFLLRPVDDGCYRLVGECYVHELMDGKTTRDEAFVEQRFLIV